MKYLMLNQYCILIVITFSIFFDMSLRVYGYRPPPGRMDPPLSDGLNSFIRVTPVNS